VLSHIPLAMSEPLRVSVVPAPQLGQHDRNEIVALCSCVFETDYSLFLNDFVGATHVVGHLADEVVSHALWLPRRLLVEGQYIVESAYVEAVATWPRFEGRGFGSALMRRLQGEITDFDLGALSTGIPAWYERLGWRPWLGRKYVRRGQTLTETPDERVMVFEIAGKPLPDVSKSLTAEWRPNEAW
jgi:aminoglycoside 2'-N-acetyltransferase I